MNAETPNTVHGRLLEAVHIAGYTFERAYAELEWLLEEDRWQSLGFDNINKFLGTIDFSEFRVAIAQRQRIAKLLASIEASQRATARLLGVDEGTVRTDLGKRADLSAAALKNERPVDNELGGSADKSAWFQSDADPSSEAKRVTRNQERERDRATLARPTPHAATGRYQLILADPPWQYEHVETESRAIENQYPTMTHAEICALDVPAAADSVLFLWATSPKLAEAMQVLEAWQFTYRTCAVWDKGVLGMGYYFRQQHELLLVAMRGTVPAPPQSARVASVIHARRGRHSAKPVVVYELLEEMYPDLDANARVELFARDRRDGWAAWGNQIAVTA